MRVTAVHISNFKSISDTGEIKLDDINVIVGRNNSGKSAFIRAIHLLQGGSDLTGSPVRLGENNGFIRYKFSGTNLYRDFNRFFDLNFGSSLSATSATLTIDFRRMSDRLDFARYSLSPDQENASDIGARQIVPTEPTNFIYPYLTTRKVSVFDQSVDLKQTRTVATNLSNLYAKVDRISSPQHYAYEEYASLCEKVLGFLVGAQASTDGKVAGIPVGRDDYIALSSMGDGVPSLLGLIVNLCVAENHLFLIEELENDVHPHALKSLLNAIIRKSQTNQFIISTHSNVVVKHLGSASNCRIFAMLINPEPRQIPTTTITEIERTPEARISVLRELGYELTDFDLWAGWLILEESTAEIIIRKYLIPWFAPGLMRVRTVSAGGTSKAAPTFQDFWRLFLFLHLESHYKNRAWVVLDGDDSGKDVVERLRMEYKTWPSDHFTTFNEANFERYYPPKFSEEVERVLAMKHDEKKNAKEELVKKVRKWCDKNTEEARLAFEKSASPVIETLKKIEESFAE